MKYVNKLSFKQIFWIFLVGSVIGAYYEELLFIVRNYLRTRTFAWQPRRGVFWGPISPVYGIGAIVLSMFLGNKKESIIKTFFKATILGGVVEYILSYLQEFFIGTSSWNYSAKFLNINGRTTVIYMLFWGLIGVLFVKLIYPGLLKFVDYSSKILKGKLTTILFVILAFDITISWSALIRQRFRRENLPPITVVGKLYDEYFNDEYIKSKFPNMKMKLN